MTGAYTPVLTVSHDGDVVVAGDLTLNSDVRLKTDIAPMSRAGGGLSSRAGVLSLARRPGAGFRAAFRVDRPRGGDGFRNSCPKLKTAFSP